MNHSELFNIIKQKKSFLCIGLDTAMDKIPKHLLKFDDPIFEFNKRIIDATIDKAVAYKLNAAFYEAEGINGWISMHKTIEYLNTFNKDVFTIADAKRGDIGNTSKMYAKAFFEKMKFNAITVSPYMGEDSVKPFYDLNAWVIILALTSNAGSADFQLLTLKHMNSEHLFEEVIRTSQNWGSIDNTMYVIGATKSEHFKFIRQLIPHHFLLVPGIGAQGGNLQEVAENGLNDTCGLLVNSSRDIIYAASDYSFVDVVRQKTLSIAEIMEDALERKGLL